MILWESLRKHTSPQLENPVFLHAQISIMSLGIITGNYYENVTE